MNDYFVFPGGEVHLKLTEQTNEIVCKDYTMNGFMAICEQKEILSRHGFDVLLTYPYFPYARQDRVIVEDEPFSLKVFCNLLNTQNFKSVTIWDPHSDVAPALINNCVVVPQWEIARKAIPPHYFTDPDVLWVSPDAGAQKKLLKLVPQGTVAIGTKLRNNKGEISRTAVYSPVSVKNKTCVIVDDICDGGKTFTELAKTLRIQGAKSVVLYVTHGIFSKGFDELKQHLDKIYTTNSFSHNENSEFLEMVCL
jgi:ribose-phosphate pyrophosphokinase